uniref:HD-GYP domain-containing protein n=1 Tax=Magnetococcus massalia (strain MO-1) TaxID=451514 RepID=A0A1S7LNJ6_MAGMO|nr:Conserved protein of unknown function. Containing HD domain (metal dependent phosphohydrolases) [Candidatus Magnetococcus massalia]
MDPTEQSAIASSTDLAHQRLEREYPLDDALSEQGLVLTRDVVRDGMTYLTAGAELNPRTLAQLHGLGVTTLYAKPRIAEKTAQAATRLNAMFDAGRAVIFAEGVKSTREAMEALKRKDFSELQPFKEEIAELLEAIMDQYTEYAAESIKELSQHDEPSVIHGVETAFFAIELARALNWSSTRVMQAGVAGMVHDVGKAAVSKELLHHAGTLSDAQREEIERHALIGYLMLSNNEQIKDISAYCAGAHHERYELDAPGGYGILTEAHELNGDLDSLYAESEREIAQLISIADVYSALRTGYGTKGLISPLETLIEMNEMAASGAFNPRFYKVWYKNFRKRHRMLLQKGLMLTLPASLQPYLVNEHGDAIELIDSEQRLSFEEINRLQILPKLLAKGLKLANLKRRNGITQALLDHLQIPLDEGVLEKLEIGLEKPLHYNLVLVDVDDPQQVQCLIMKQGDSLKDIQEALASRRLDPIQKQLLELRNIAVDFTTLIHSPV